MKKSFGQNLLIDKTYLNKIIEHIEVTKKDLILEIGSGAGALTIPLSNFVKKIFAVEIERDILKELNKNICKSNIENVEIIEKNFLALDIKNLFKEKFTVVGNIPYNITSKILLKLFGEIDSPSEHFSNLNNVYLMVQYEVAERLAAKPHSKTYSPLSILINYFTEPKILFKIPPSAFFPKPKVTSAFIELKPKKRLLKIQDPIKVKKIIRTAFQQKRKKIVNSLESIVSDKKEFYKVFEKVKISAHLRPENLSLEDFILLSENIN